MGNTDLKKRPFAAVLLGAILLTSLCGCTSAEEVEPTALCASIEETPDKVRVFIGDTENAPADYAQERAEYIESLAAKDAKQDVQAVITLDDYYTVDEITVWAESYDLSLNRIYMWPKGETGRLVLIMDAESSIYDRIEDYKRQIDAEGTDDEQFKKDYQRLLNGEYGIFALTASASAETLAELSANADYVSLVDVMHNAEVEEYAKQVGKPVSYLELPAKPDGVG